MKHLKVLPSLAAALTFLLATLSQSAFAMYYACQKNSSVVSCDATSTEMEITNIPTTGYEQGSFGFRVISTNTSPSSKLISISVASDRVVSNGKFSAPALFFFCDIKPDSHLFEVARTLASSDMPVLTSVVTEGGTRYQGQYTIKIKWAKAPTGSPNCTALEYSRGWR